MSKKVILAIETSCDETGAAVVIDGQIKSNIIASSAPLQAKYGGVVPEIAARSHITAIIPTIDLALKKANTNLKNLDYIAVTSGPGLATSLMVGADTARAIGVALDILVIPINHLEAHIYANFINAKVKFPAIILIVSGGHTLLVEMKNHGKYRILGETLDDAAGEAFDKTAKMLDLGYPGGPQISRLAKSGDAQAFNFPRPMINSKNLEFSFSGLKTAVLYEIQKHKKITPKLKSDFATSVQAAIVETLIHKLEKAVRHLKPKSIMLGGGVAANQLLRQEFLRLGKKYKVQAVIPAIEYCTDNAAMIGLAAYYRLKNKRTNVKNFSIDPNLKLK